MCLWKEWSWFDLHALLVGGRSSERGEAGNNSTEEDQGGGETHDDWVSESD